LGGELAPFVRYGLTIVGVEGFTRAALFARLERTAGSVTVQVYRSPDGIEWWTDGAAIVLSDDPTEALREYTDLGLHMKVAWTPSNFTGSLDIDVVLRNF
jgi:hypothetical protein